MEKLFNKLKKNQIHPVIAKRIGLSDVPDAHVFLEKGKARGPIVCLPWKRSPKLLHEDDHVPNEISAGPTEEAREEEHEQHEEPPVDDKKESQKKRGLFRRRSKAQHHEEHDEREDADDGEDEKSKKSKRSWRKKKGKEVEHPDDEE